MTALALTIDGPATGLWISATCTHCTGLLELTTPRRTTAYATAILTCTNCGLEHQFAAHLHPLNPPTHPTQPAA